MSNTQLIETLLTGRSGPPNPFQAYLISRYQSHPPSLLGSVSFLSALDYWSNSHPSVDSAGNIYVV